MSRNDFAEDLSWSNDQHLQDWWQPYYEGAFPGVRQIRAVAGPSAEQSAGIDKWVTLKCGKVIAVDEKVRRTRPPRDILLEWKHVTHDKSRSWPGWIEKENQFTDFIAIGFQAFRVAFFFPFPTLQYAWLKKKSVWIERYSIPPSPNPRENPRYWTYNVAIPTGELCGWLLDAMRVQL